ASLMLEALGVEEAIDHLPRIVDRSPQRLVVGGEVVERAVLVALRDVGVGEPHPAEALAPAVAADDAADPVLLNGSPARVVALRARHRLGFYRSANATSLVQMTSELRRAAQLFFRARFDLPHALAREVQAVADLLQRVLFVVLEA